MRWARMSWAGEARSTTSRQADGDGLTNSWAGEARSTTSRQEDGDGLTDSWAGEARSTTSRQEDGDGLDVMAQEFMNVSPAVLPIKE